MPARRESAEAQRYRRRLLATAFRGGGRALAEGEETARPNRPLYAGIAVAVIAVLAAAAHGYLGGVPSGWRANGNLVVDRQNGGRYLSVHGTLHPVPNLTSLLLLTGGHVPTPVRVDDDTLRSAPLGPPLGVAAAPDAPPRLPASPTLTACTTAQGEAILVIDPQGGRRLAAQGLLVRTPEDPTVQLVTGRSAYQVASDRALTALGYSTDQVTTVPAAWLGLFERGPTLRLLRLPDAKPPAKGHPVPPVQQVGRVVVDTDTGRRFLVDGHGLRPIANTTSELLLAGGERPAKVAHAQVVARPVGEPYGLTDVPKKPPKLPAAGAAAVGCLPAKGDGLRLHPRLPVPSGYEQQPRIVSPSGSGGRARVESRPGTGALLAVAPAKAAASDARALYLVAAGAAYPLGSDQAATTLGYRPGSAVEVPAAWLHLLPAGPRLEQLTP